MCFNNNTLILFLIIFSEKQSSVSNNIVLCVQPLMLGCHWMWLMVFSLLRFRSVKDWYSFSWVSVFPVGALSSSLRAAQSSENTSMMQFCCRATSTLHTRDETHLTHCSTTVSVQYLILYSVQTLHEYDVFYLISTDVMKFFMCSDCRWWFFSSGLKSLGSYWVHVFFGYLLCNIQLCHYGMYAWREQMNECVCCTRLSVLRSLWCDGRSERPCLSPALWCWSSCPGKTDTPRIRPERCGPRNAPENRSLAADERTYTWAENTQAHKICKYNILHNTNKQNCSQQATQYTKLSLVWIFFGIDKEDRKLNQWEHKIICKYT